MSGYDDFAQAWGNASLPTSNGAAFFDHNAASSHVQSQSLQQHGAPVPAYYPKLNQIAAASEAPQQHAAAYPALVSPVQAAPTVTAGQQFTGGASGSAPRDTRRGHKLEQSRPQAAAVSPQLNISGLPQDYHHLSTGWAPAPSDAPVNARRPSQSGSHGRQPGVDYSLPSPTQPSLGRQRRSSSQHYDPPSPQEQARKNARGSVDAGPETQQRCIIPRCQYAAYYNVAEQEQMEYCGHGHELCV
ncbi:hypothetical protein EDB83DRAFT_2421664 [Lactarius deliciosus]|nr:hypothetical protein EDB83DRAFT_2421664 [Lactarius deliciosus]